MHGVSDRARSGHTLRWRCTRCCLPLSSTAAASRSTCRLRSGACISRLNTRPVRSPVNASTPPSRAAPHDSGPLWFAIPSTYETFIHNTLPVLTGARRIHETQSQRILPVSQITFLQWRELVSKPKPIRLGVQRFERVSGTQITGRAKTDEPQGSTTRRDMCDLPRRVY
jgi:hypothetical protein